GILTQKMVPNAVMFQSTSGAGLLRRISQQEALGLPFVPCVDEVDGIFRGETEGDIRLRSVWNANKTDDAQTVQMAEQTDQRRKFEQIEINIWAPRAAIDIDELPGTMKSRSRIARVFRTPDKIPPVNVEQHRVLTSRLQRWVRDNA